MSGTGLGAGGVFTGLGRVGGTSSLVGGGKGTSVSLTGIDELGLDGSAERKAKKSYLLYIL